MILLVFYLFLALIVSFSCSIMEAVLLSASVPYLKSKEKGDGKNVKRILKLKENIDRPLSAILSLNTVAHTIGAAGVGAQAVEVFGEAYFGVVSAVLTILILVITEIIPKTIGARYWKKIVFPVAKLIHFSVIISYPLVLFSAFLTKLLSSNDKEQTVSREEISVLANIGMQEGVFQNDENKIIQNLIGLQKIKTEAVMTPRVVVAVADENMTIEEFTTKKEYSRFSRIPVFAGNKEYITGYVFRQDVFDKNNENDKGLKLKELKRDIVVLPNTKPLFGTFRTLLEKKEHIAIIIDEYGGMDGIVTLEDVFETLLGIEITDETDSVEDMQEYAREIWKKRKNTIPNKQLDK